MLKWISFDFLLWLKIAFSHKQHGNCQSKNLASHGAFLGFWEDFGGGGWFCLYWLSSPQRSGALDAAKPAEHTCILTRASSHTALGFIEPMWGGCWQVILSRHVLPFVPFALRDGGMFLLPCSKVNIVKRLKLKKKDYRLKRWGHMCRLMLPCVTTHLGSLGC